MIRSGRPDSEAPGGSILVRVGLGNRDPVAVSFPCRLSLDYVRRPQSAIRRAYSVFLVGLSFWRPGLFWSRDMVCGPGKAGVECAETAIEGQ